MLTPTVRRTLAPRGRTPIQYCWDRRDRISAFSAITVSAIRKHRGLYFSLLADNENVHAEDVVGFLRQLRRHIPGPITIIWDRSKVHDRSKAVQAYLAKHPTKTIKVKELVEEPKREEIEKKVGTIPPEEKKSEEKKSESGSSGEEPPSE